MSRLAGLRGAHRYGLVLLTVMATFVLLSAGGNSIAVRVGAAALQMITLVLVFYTGSVATSIRRTVLFIIVAGALLVGTSFLASADVTRGMTAFVNAVFVMTAIVGIVRGLARQPTIDVKTVFGALAIYLLFGLFFAWVYAVIGAFLDESFFAGGQEESTTNFLYFSYITQTTVGYGDFVAGNSLGRTLAVMQALTGQIYLVTVVGVVVSRLNVRRRQPAGPQA